MSHATEDLVAADVDRATLSRQVECLIERLHPAVSRERRHDDRIAIPVLFRLTPLDAADQPIDAQISIVVGKNISRRGISFFHEKPLSYRRAFIELAHPGAGSFAAEIDIRWCCFTRPGWYESGGRLIRSLALNDELERGTLPYLAQPPENFAESVVGFIATSQCRI